MPKWKPEGSREEICKNYRWVKRWLWSYLSYQINERDNYTCQDCNLNYKKPESHDFTVGLETHHIIPQSKGGSDHPHNLKTLCQKCHRKYTNDLLKNKQAYDKEQICLRNITDSS